MSVLDVMAFASQIASEMDDLFINGDGPNATIHGKPEYVYHDGDRRQIRRSNIDGRATWSVHQGGVTWGVFLTRKAACRMLARPWTERTRGVPALLGIR